MCKNLFSRTNDTGFWQDLMRRHCNIRRDHDDFLAGQELDDDAFAVHFDGLRRVFPDRLEYDRFILDVSTSTSVADRLAQLGFHLKR